MRRFQRRPHAGFYVCSFQGHGMIATEFLEKARDPIAWRKHSRALRRSAIALWNVFETTVIDEIEAAAESKTEPTFAAALEALETAKLLYGLALETALKAWIVEHHPAKIEVRVVMDGKGEATGAELRALGVPTSNGHNLLALAEAAELFGDRFRTVIRTDGDVRTVKNICRDLGEVVVWRGRYPVPLTSSQPQRLDPNAPVRALAHYMRDWLDPVLDALLVDDSEVSRQGHAND